MSGADWATLLGDRKTKNLKPIHDMKSTPQSAASFNPAITPAIAPGCHVFKLGLDVDLHFVVTAIQCEHGANGYNSGTLTDGGFSFSSDRSVTLSGAGSRTNTNASSKSSA